MKGRNLILAACLLTAVAGCEDVINPAVEPAVPTLVIDAWLTNEPGPKTIQLSLSQDYFNSSPLATVSGGIVQIEDDQGSTFDFNEESIGNYVWNPSTPGETFGEIGRSYTLTVSLDGETYQATSAMNRVPTVDSIVVRQESTDPFWPDNAIIAQFYASDFAGSGDAYWIRAYKNGQYLNKPNEINIAFDAGFSRGGDVDGLIFIQPLREGINPQDEDEDEDILSPYAIGDSVFVELYSITNEAFDYLSGVRLQTDRPGGFGELFATPPANIRNNIKNVNPNAKDQALGYFAVSAVSGLGLRITEDIVDEN